MFTQEYYFSEIQKRLNWINATIASSSSLNLNDICIHSETFFCNLLNFLFGYNLRNMNNSINNYPSIDLADEDNSIAIQVTCDNTSEKIKHTLEIFFQNNLHTKYNTLQILIVGKNKKKYRTQFEVPDYFNFSNDNILDSNDLIKEISTKSFEQLEKIYAFLYKQLLPSNGYYGNPEIIDAESVQKNVSSLCQLKMQALNIAPEIVSTIIYDEVHSDKYQYILDGLNDKKHYLIGDFGSGKSHAIYIITLRLLNEYFSRKCDTYPIFVEAKDIINEGSIREWIKKHTLFNTKHILFIDGLDELAIENIKKLIEEINLQDTVNPNIQIFATSRPLTLFSVSPTNKITINMPSLSVDEELNLMKKITEEKIHLMPLHVLDKSMQKTLSKPFFCILYAILTTDFSKHFKQEIDLITEFVNKALSDTSDSDLLPDLAQIAQKTIDRNHGLVHITELSLHTTNNDLLKTGFLLYKDNERSFEYTLPIIAQWMASEAIILNQIQIDDIIADEERLSHWIYPLSILFYRLTFKDSLEIFSKIVQEKPGVAAYILKNGISLESNISLPSSQECENMIAQSMHSWVNGLGPLGRYIAPLYNNQLKTPSVRKTQDSLTCTWLSLDFNSPDPKTPSIDNGHSNYFQYNLDFIPSQSTWPWFLTFDQLSCHLDKIIKNHLFIPPQGQLFKEYIWECALSITQNSNQYEKPIPFSFFREFRDTHKLRNTSSGRLIDYELFFEEIETLKSQGQTQLNPPFPVSDKSPLTCPYWAWEQYSPQKYLEKLIFVYSNALNEYEQLVELFFSTMQSSLGTYRLMPCKVVGGLVFPDSSKLESRTLETAVFPKLTWYFEALSPNSKNATDIQLKEILFYDESLLTSLSTHNYSLRPNFPFLNYDRITFTTPEIICSTPVTNIVYDWLANDLKAIGWI